MLSAENFLATHETLLSTDPVAVDVAFEAARKVFVSFLFATTCAAIEVMVLHEDSLKRAKILVHLSSSLVLKERVSEILVQDEVTDGSRRLFSLQGLHFVTILCFIVNQLVKFGNIERVESLGNILRLSKEYVVNLSHG